MKRSPKAATSASVTGRFTATIEPKAETGSHSRARRVGRDEVGAAADAARVVVLDDDHRRLVEERHELARRVGVEQVVPGELLALHLAHAAEQAGAARQAIDRGGLMRVLAVAGLELARQGERQALRQELAAAARWGCRARGGRRRRCSRAGRASWRSPRRSRRCGAKAFCASRRRRPMETAPSPLRKLGEEAVVVARVDEDGQTGEVLGRRPDHRRPADVDHLDRLRLGDPGARDRALERVEVDHHEVEALDAVLRESGGVRGCERSARMPPWIRGCSVLTRPSRISGKPVTSETPVDGEPRRREVPPGAAGRDELEPERGEAVGELDESGLVGDGEQRAGGGRHLQLLGSKALDRERRFERRISGRRRRRARSGRCAPRRAARAGRSRRPRARRGAGRGRHPIRRDCRRPRRPRRRSSGRRTRRVRWLRPLRWHRPVRRKRRSAGTPRRSRDRACGPGRGSCAVQAWMSRGLCQAGPRP